MTDEHWGKLVKMWSSPKHKEICLLNQHNREKVQFNHRTGSRCYIAQLYALERNQSLGVCDYYSSNHRDKHKDEDPTPLELFKEFHSSQKTGFISEPVQKAIFQDLTWELYLEKVRRDELRETIEQPNLQLADLRKISVEATEARRTTTAQLEALKKEAAWKAEMIQSFRMVL
ncbi:hypothetical protein EJB05_53902 [Eragrostis curvula]|uniref:Uncharacterized protein n=1 Tax=Eragrostis curvula TaxID=38414 RepID=A0A5J9SNV1_9POAL|nr:hypothetical protein EJB05_53902 [Eragrostis curvula]